MSEKKHSGWRIVVIVIIAVALLIGISFLPLERWSGGRVKNINLFSDILNINESDEVVDDTLGIDPLLAAEIDSREVDTAAVAEGEKPLIAVQPNRENDLVVIEDYTESGHGLEHLRNALKAGRLARIAVIGDSYIEGDIFTEDLREMLQQKHGGRGVGYVNMYSEFPGFRKTVRQSGGKGWKEVAANGKHDENYMGLTQHYYKLNSATTSTYKGSSSYTGVDRWNRSKFLFFAPNDAQITLTTDAGSKTYDVVGSPNLQELTVNGSTTMFEVQTSNPSIVGLGVWLTDSAGVNVDCMSSRGFSGVTLANINPTLSSQMSQKLGYDLIILEFGINAMSAKQTNFDAYRKKMEQVVAHVRECFPNADILLMGIGDRGTKRGTEVHSMISCQPMVDAQREAARRTRTLFWDTREAMGGEDAIVTWVQNGWANKDYIHMNHNGSKHLATPMFNAIEHNLKL